MCVAMTYNIRTGMPYVRLNFIACVSIEWRAQNATNKGHTKLFSL